MSGSRVVALALLVALGGAAQLLAENARREGGGGCPNYWSGVQCSGSGDLVTQCKNAIVGTVYASCVVAEEGHSCSGTDALNCHFVT